MNALHLKKILFLINQSYSRNPGAEVRPGIIPSQDFFNAFSKWNYTVEMFAKLLEDCNLHDLLYLFREQSNHMLFLFIIMQYTYHHLFLFRSC